MVVFHLILRDRFIKTHYIIYDDPKGHEVIAMNNSNTTPKTHGEWMTPEETVSYLETVPSYIATQLVTAKDETIEVRKWNGMANPTYTFTYHGMRLEKGCEIRGRGGTGYGVLEFIEPRQLEEQNPAYQYVVARLDVYGGLGLYIPSGWMDISEGGLLPIRCLEDWLRSYITEDDVDLEDLINDAYGSIEICGRDFYAYDILNALGDDMLDDAMSEQYERIAEEMEDYPSESISQYGLDGCLAYWDAENEKLYLGREYGHIEEE